MKKITILALLISLAIPTLAQRHRIVKNLPNYDQKTWHFGFTVGGNNMGFRIDKCDDFFDRGDIYGIEAEKKTGFHIGPIANYRLGKYFDLRGMFYLSFNQRDLIYYYKEDGSNEMLSHRMMINSTMLEFPVCIKYKAERYGNVAPYLVAGACYKYDLGANKAVKASELPKIKLMKHDPCAEWGGGLDFYLQYFKLSVELKYSLGWKNMVKYDDTMYTNCINKLTSNALMLSLHFE